MIMLTPPTTARRAEWLQSTGFNCPLRTNGNGSQLRNGKGSQNTRKIYSIRLTGDSNQGLSIASPAFSPLTTTTPLHSKM